MKGEGGDSTGWRRKRRSGGYAAFHSGKFAAAGRMVFPHPIGENGSGMDSIWIRPERKDNSIRFNIIIIIIAN